MRQNHRVLTAIILAAGRGNRLGALTEREPKCLLTVGPRTLLEHQLAALASHGITQVVVVAGHRHQAVKTRLEGRATVVVNERHASTNSLFSLWLARDHARDGFLLLNADVLFDPGILGRVLECPHPEALAVERRAEFTAEEMKVELEGERIRALSKTLPAERAQAENLGVLKFSPEGSRRLFAKIEELLARGGEREFCPYAFHALADELPLYAVPVDGLPWIEIDFLEDLRRAREEVWPAIEARQTQRQALEVAPVHAANPPPLPCT